MSFAMVSSIAGSGGTPAIRFVIALRLVTFVGEDSERSEHRNDCQYQE
jgi:hypothetical protein